MPAEIDSMMYVNEVPWHRMGRKLDHPATAKEAMVASGLGWDVQLQPVYTGYDRNIKVKDRFAVCRTDRLEHPDGGQLGVVGRDYQPLNNQDAFSFLDPLVGENAAVYHTAGALRGGRRVWMLAKLPGVISVIGDDITEKYILLSNSFDGTAAIRIGMTPIRVVCQNTLNLALSGMSGLSIKHHGDVVQRVRQAHQLLGLVNTAFDHVGSTMKQMARTQITQAQLLSYYDAIFPKSIPSENGTPKQIQRQERLINLFEAGIGQDLPGVRGTVWAGYNSVTQYVDRELCTRRNKEPLNSIWFGEGVKIKHKAFNLAASLADLSAN